MTNEYDDLIGEIPEGLAEVGQSTSKFAPAMPLYKVWNTNMKDPTAPSYAGKMLIVTSSKNPTPTGDTDKWLKKVEVIDQVNAVILYHSLQRTLKGNKGAPICRSHGSPEETKTVGPSASIDSPLCRQATAADVVKVIGAFKGFDQARINATIAETVDGSGCLKACGMKTRDGMIPLCPAARKNPITGQSAACKESRYVIAYDIDRDQLFKMELGFSSIKSDQRYVAPFPQFLNFLRTSGPKKDGKTVGLASYMFTVRLSSLQDGAFFLLNVQNQGVISSKETRETMKQKAIAAKEGYIKDSERLSKAAWEAQRNAQKGAAAPDSTTTTAFVAAPPAPQPAAQAAVVPASPFATTFGGDNVSWDELGDD